MTPPIEPSARGGGRSCVRYHPRDETVTAANEGYLPTTMEPRPRRDPRTPQRPIVGLVSVDPALPSFRLRVAPLVPHLEALGLDARVPALRGPEWLRTWRLARAWRESDVLVFSKVKLLLGELGFVARLCHTWVLDVDDAIMFRKPPRHGDPPDRARWRQRRFRRMVQRCRLVVAASQSLASMIEGECTRTEVLPTPVALERYPQAPLTDTGRLKLAWIGLGANLRYLSDLTPVLQGLARDGFSFELRVISDRLPAMEGVPCRLVPWSEEAEGAALSACDVGLAPLPDDAWTRGKGAYRSIQYAAAGLPTVASPVGANCEVVVPGETGLWAGTPQQWRDAVERLGHDLALRRRLGEAARHRARAFERAVVLPRYADFLMQLVDRPD